MSRAARLRVARNRTRRRACFFTGVVSLFTLTLLISLAGWVLVPALAMRWTPRVITSGSMSPTIPRGEIVLTQPDSGVDLAPGVVISFDTDYGVETHRIVKQVSSREYVTKGDANRQADSTPVHDDDIVGVGRLVVPIIGQFLLFGRHSPMHALLVVAFFMVLVIVARWSLVREFDPWGPEMRADEQVGRPRDPDGSGPSDGSPPEARRWARPRRQRREVPVGVTAMLVMMTMISTVVMVHAAPAAAAWSVSTTTTASFSSGSFGTPSNPVTSVTCTAAQSLVTITWTPATGDWVTGYRAVIKRPTQADIVQTVSGGATSSMVVDLTGKKPGKYRVELMSISSDGTYSTVVTFEFVLAGYCA